MARGPRGKTRFSSIEEFERAPIGKTAHAPEYQVWCVDDGLCVTSLWGRPGVDTVRELVRLAEVAFHPAMRAPFDTLIDVRGLLSVDRGGFQVLAEYVERRPDLKSRVRRQAILRPGGFVGALAAGFLQVFDAFFPARVLTDARDAFAWLERPDAEELTADLADRLASTRDLHPIVLELRVRLDEDAAVDLSAMARALGASRRSLQRQLALAGTTFRNEANAARVRSAQRLLLDTDRKISAIALDVGCSSPQHLGLLFRQHIGTSPRAWRARMLAARG